MRLLLDTHVFLWFISADVRLPVTWRDAMRDTENEVFLSAVSVWEAMVKYALGKSPLRAPLIRNTPLLASDNCVTGRKKWCQ